MPLHVSSTCAYHQDVKIAVHNLWYRHTETCEWSEISKIQFYKYEQIVVKYMCEFSGVITVYYYKHVMSCRGYVYPVIKLIS